MYSFNFTYNTNLMHFMTKLESYIEKQENCWWSRSIATFVYIIHVLAFQSESQWCFDSDWIFSFFQVEVAKQKKQHENNQIYFIDIPFLETFFYYLLIGRTYIFYQAFCFFFIKPNPYIIIIPKNTWKLPRNCKQFNVHIFLLEIWFDFQDCTYLNLKF